MRFNYFVVTRSLSFLHASFSDLNHVLMAAIKTFVHKSSPLYLKPDPECLLMDRDSQLMIENRKMFKSVSVFLTM